MRRATVRPIARRRGLRSYLRVLLPGLLLWGCPTAADGQVTVGSNIHVSASHAADGLGEVWMSADPTDPTRLLACGIVYAQNTRWTVVYVSTDRGQHWRPTLETNKYSESADPACTLGSNGIANHAATIASASEGFYGLAVYRSSNGGQTWKEEQSLPSMDRESIIVDTTDSSYRGRVYVTGATGILQTDNTGPIGMGLWTSTDGGITFGKPSTRASPPGRHTLSEGNSVVLSDGTLMAIFSELLDVDSIGFPLHPKEGYKEAVLEVSSSRDGGETTERVVKIADKFQGKMGRGTGLAVDPGSAAFEDRLYAVWTDVRSGQAEILLSVSIDKGKTWSPPRRVNDVAPEAKEVVGANVFMPNVVVSKDGIVAVTWYDRHDTPENLGWYVRFRASLDGGETWLPSVRVSSAPNRYDGTEPLITRGFGGGREIDVTAEGRQFMAGDYSGLAADCGGLFHVLWIDNRTGLPQMWTATVAVEGSAVKHGDATLAKLDDVSDQVTFEVTHTRLDRATGTVRLLAQVKNMSKNTLHGAFKVRGIDFTSDLAEQVRTTNSTNGVNGPGAVWDYTDAVHGGILRPGELSDPKELTFTLSTWRPLYESKGRDFRTGVLMISVLVLVQTDHQARNAEPQ